MKTKNSTPSSTLFFKMLVVFILLSSCMVKTNKAQAQCGVGYTQVTLNWDNLSYLSRLIHGSIVTTAQDQTQYYMFGNGQVAFNVSALTVVGDTNTNTVNADYDVMYQTPTGSGATSSITITFDHDVRNVAFSLHDIDARQQVTVNAKNAASVDVTTIISKRNFFGAILTLTPFSGIGTNPYATANNTTVANNNADGTIDVSMAGPLRTITLSFTNVGGTASSPDVFLSDITACDIVSHPTNYHQIASVKPFINQPDYFITTPDNNSAYYIDPVTGKSKWLFTDAGTIYINSFAYDQVNKFLYYVADGSATPSTNKALKKYDLNTETISTLVADMETTLGIPMFNSGVESGAAAFYDGDLYLGIEGNWNSSANKGLESVVWKINFNASNVPVSPAVQVVAYSAYYASSTSYHDWGDFIVKDGKLLDFNSARAGTSPNFTYAYSNVNHYDLINENMTVYANPAGAAVKASFAGNVGMNWAGTIYSTRDSIRPYDNAGNLGARTFITAVSGPAWVGSTGDGSEPFKPKSDFGDAPASYTPAATDPANHEKDVNLRLGATFDHEWVVTPSALADADGADEDGIGAAPSLNYNGTITYSINVSVFNNTGVNATMIGWLDYNFNGLFDAGEGVSANVFTNAATQNIALTWSNISVPNVAFVRTFLRIRITKAANGMSTSTPNDWFNDGEVEDYPVLMGTLLAKEKISLTAAKNKNTVDVNWNIKSNNEIVFVDVERSADGINWLAIKKLAGSSTFFNDNSPLTGTSYYRIKAYSNDATFKYSEYKMVAFNVQPGAITLLANPVTDKAVVNITSSAATQANIEIYDLNGALKLKTQKQLNISTNSIELQEIKQFAAGMYVIYIEVDKQLKAIKFVKQ
jgi:GEVED domain/Secretion system C-terminal sorting domain